MRILKGNIKVSEHDFIVTPEMYTGIKYIEVDLSKTIDSFAAVMVTGNNLLTMFPVVADEYYYFHKIHVYNFVNNVNMSFTTIFLGGGSHIISVPIAIWDSTATAVNYQKSWLVEGLFVGGFSASDDFDDVSCFGIKVNTS